MKLSNNYMIFQSNNQMFLTNISNGDLFEINDVVNDIIQRCHCSSRKEDLVDFIFEKYKDEDGAFSKDDLLKFVEEMISNGIIIE